MENVLIVNNEKAYEVKCNSNYYITKNRYKITFLNVSTIENTTK